MTTQNQIEQYRGQALQLLKSEPIEAARKFNRLSPLEQEQVLASVSGKNFLELLLMAKEPHLLISRFSPQDIYLNIIKIGPQDSTSLVAISTSQQFQLLVDMEFFDKDQWLRTDKILQWFSILVECGSKKVVEIFNSLDMELLVLIFKQLVEVYIPNPDLDKEENQNLLPKFTLDGTYFLNFKNHSAAQLLPKLLMPLIVESNSLYHSLLLQVLMEWNSQVESEATSWREKRLLDLGFPARDEAAPIYTFINDKGIEHLPQRIKSLRPLEDKNAIHLQLLYEPENLFNLAVERLVEPDVAEEIYFEITVLANKIWTLSNFTELDLESLKFCLKKARNFITMGARFLGGNSVEGMAKILGQYYLQSLFQLGFSQAIKLKLLLNRFRQSEWLSTYKEIEQYFPDSYQEVISGLGKHHPCYFDQSYSQGTRFRDFQTLEEVLESEKRLREISGLGELLFKGFGLNAAILDQAGEKNEDLDLKMVFNTLAINRLSRDRWELIPLESGQLLNFIREFFSQEGKLAKPWKNGLIEQIEHLSMNCSQENRSAMILFCRQQLKNLELELAPLSNCRETDIRFVQDVWVSF